MIKISQRLRPFSHLPKATCLLPTTQCIVEACPALVRIQEFSGKVVKELKLDVQGPLKQFTLMQDLERGCVTLFSEQYRFHILPSLEIVFQKNPPLPPLELKERLSLGSHKKQEWEMIKRRCDFREIFPLWLRLGSLLKLPKRKRENVGIFGLLEECREAVHSHRSETIIPAFERLFLAGFGKMLVPRSEDTDFQGILPADFEPSLSSPLYLLTEGAELIRSLFLLSSENEIAILPNLPPEFFAGRLVNLKTDYGEIDLEWSKKTVRRLIFRATKSGEMTFHFRSNLRRYRLRTNLREKGATLCCGESLEIKSGSHYLLDQFTK